MVTKDEEMQTKHEIKEFLFSQKYLEERAIGKFSTIQINTRQCTAMQRNTEQQREIQSGAAVEGIMYSCIARVNDTGSESGKGRFIHTHTRNATITLILRYCNVGLVTFL